MLESEVNDEQNCSKKDCCDHHEDCRALKLVPRRPAGLLGEFRETLFKVLDKLSHLYI